MSSLSQSERTAASPKWPHDMCDAEEENSLMHLIKFTIPTLWDFCHLTLTQIDDFGRQMWLCWPLQDAGHTLVQSHQILCPTETSTRQHYIRWFQWLSISAINTSWWIMCNAVLWSHFKVKSNCHVHKQSSCLKFQQQRSLACLLLGET